MTTFSFPVNFHTEMIHQLPNTKIYFPQVIGMNSKVERTMNTKIKQTSESQFHKQFKMQNVYAFAQMVGLYEIKTNQRNVLSLTLSNYAIANHAANGLTLMDSLTFDLETGRTYELKDLFRPGSNYVRKLSQLVERQLKERQIPTIEPFKGISPNQKFYIADKCLILYFDALEFTPHYVGIPLFPISVFELEDLVSANGPLGRMDAAT